MRTKYYFCHLFIFFLAALNFSGCKKTIFELNNGDFNVKAFISNIKSYNVKADYNENTIPIDTTSAEKPYISVQSYVIKGKDILISITLPSDAEELYFGAVNSQMDYMGLNFSGQNQNSAVGYYSLKLNNITTLKSGSDGLKNYQVVLSSNENIQIDKFDLIASYKTSTGISNKASVPMDVISIAPHQKNLRVGFRPLTGYTYSIKINAPDGSQIIYSYNKSTGIETFDKSQTYNSTLSYDSDLDFKWIDFTEPHFGGYTMTATIQIDMADEFQYIELYLAIITEGKIDQVSLDADIQQTGQNTALGTGNVWFSYFDKLAYKINITKIWSDQFENQCFNFLLGGAGSQGNIAKRILMGTRSNSVAYAKAELKITPQNNGKSNIQVRFAQNNSGTIQLFGEGKLEGNIATVWVSSNAFDQIPSEYSIIAWIDDNNNNNFDVEEQYYITPEKCAIVNNTTYNVTLQSLLTQINLSSWVTEIPRARAFFKAFLTNSPIEYGGTFQASPIQFNSIETELKQMLAYNVGVDLTSANSAFIKSLFFGSNSLLAVDIINSDSFKNILLSVLETNENKIKQSYPAITTFSWPLPNAITFPINSAPGTIDFDLSRVFHDALLNGSFTIHVACSSGHIVLQSIEISGSLKDLYDHNYTNPSQLGHQGLLIQAGYGTIGNGGGVFRVEVNLSSIINNFSYDFGNC
jgi:hypothetical protein